MEPLAESSSRPSGPPGSSSNARSFPPGHHPSSSTTVTSNGSSGSQPQPQHHHEEDRLGRAWRSMASSVVMSTQKAEKTASQLPHPSKECLKELDEAVVTFLRTRMEWTRQISHIQAKLQGKEQEMEAMDCYLRSQPRLGRKRRKLVDNNNTSTATNAVGESIMMDEPAVVGGVAPAYVDRSVLSVPFASEF